MANILLVEDEHILERIMMLNLVKRGHSVAEAATAEEADTLAIAAVPPFDLIILDINLPDQTGWDLLRRWKARPAFRIPPYIVTTAIRPHDERIREFGPTAVLLKPFVIESLLHLIDRALTPVFEQDALVDIVVES